MLNIKKCILITLVYLVILIPFSVHFGQDFLQSLFRGTISKSFSKSEMCQEKDRSGRVCSGKLQKMLYLKKIFSIRELPVDASVYINNFLKKEVNILKVS